MNLRVLRGLAFLTVITLAWNAQPIALGSIHLYQRFLSPLAAHAGYRCRFTPTCSRYAETVIARDGIVRGGWSTMKRVIRCGPWTPPATRDDP